MLWDSYVSCAYYVFFSSVKFYADIQTALLFSRAGYDVTSCSPSGVNLDKSVANATNFELNISATVCNPGSPNIMTLSTVNCLTSKNKHASVIDVIDIFVS